MSYYTLFEDKILFKFEVIAGSKFSDDSDISVSSRNSPRLPISNLSLLSFSSKLSHVGEVNSSL